MFINLAKNEFMSKLKKETKSSAELEEDTCILMNLFSNTLFPKLIKSKEEMF